MVIFLLFPSNLAVIFPRHLMFSGEGCRDMRPVVNVRCGGSSSMAFASRTVVVFPHWSTGIPVKHDRVYGNQIPAPG